MAIKIEWKQKSTTVCDHCAFSINIQDAIKVNFSEKKLFYGLEMEK